MLIDKGSINWYEYLNKFGVEESTKGKGKRKKKYRYLNVYSAFDIETSVVWLSPRTKDDNLDVHAFMYIWQFCIEDYTVIGRTWEEFFDFLKILEDAIKRIKEEQKITEDLNLVIWDHNLGFEWAFLTGVYKFNNEDVFLREERKPLYCRIYNTFELRCSYLQTNLSLDKLCKQTNVKRKLSGQKFDYEKIRYPWTPLSDYELEYCITDVESLVQAMKYRVRRGGDTLQTVPLTSTGYVRRECKESIKDIYMQIRELKPDFEQFKLLRSAFRGGNTHANRYYVNEVLGDGITEGISSYDFASCYPAQQLTQKFPMKPFQWITLDKNDPKKRLEKVYKDIGLGNAVVGLYQFKNIRLKNKREPIPYISYSRCEAKGAERYDTDGVDDNGEEYKKGDKVHPEDLDLIVDNGRILQCAFMSISLTELDLSIVLSQYTYDSMDVVKAMRAKKDFLPYAYRLVILKYFEKKTALKGDDTEDGKYLYAKSKEDLNSVFGMSCQNPVHNDIVYDPDHNEELYPEHEGDYYTKCYDDYIDKDKKAEGDDFKKINDLLKTASFPYQWGVYCTALARKRLQEAIDLTKKKRGSNNLESSIVYCDTDSIKVIGDVDLTKFNEKLKSKAEEVGAYATDRNGVVHYIGVMELDAKYKKFCTQGSKKYCYLAYDKETGKDHLGVTVAGVSKKKNEETGESYAVEELGSIENFKPGFKWEKAGGTGAVYNPHDDFYYTDPETGKQVHITSNVAIIPSTYVLGYSDDYEKLLNEIQLYGDFKRERE